ncbi:uncharacterized protein N7484_006733 [Penicillium longicatenatum]|uniref:uncharacterized protein n=1 Tax=Penicillium longicatenatum TaxID=1561947 RepID=UPI0025467DC4|nr:uncharacterized protein N7484_006733 [Penicillium longicatenatum]KAJ5644226.1 hypothetical protein N7484_006733 [Penicillium longicatenatum]
MNPRTNFQPSQTFEAYIFYQLGFPSSASGWKIAERCQQFMPQNELSTIVFSRASIVSATRQYVALDNILQQQINRLLAEKRYRVPAMEWSCAAAHFENTGFTRDCLSVIIFGRRIEEKINPRTLMGDYVDLDTCPKLAGGFVPDSDTEA